MYVMIADMCVQPVIMTERHVVSGDTEKKRIVVGNVSKSVHKHCFNEAILGI